MKAGEEKARATVRVGNVSIPIFQWTPGRWWVRWREDGKIWKRRYKSPEKAKALARVIATRLNNGLPSLADITAADRQIYHHARPPHSPTPVRVLTVSDAALWKQMLPEQSPF